MSCDRRCDDPNDPMYDSTDQPDCNTCPGRDSGPTAPNVIHAQFTQPGRLEGEMAAALTEVIYSYAERVSVAQVIGVLEIVKTEVMGAQ